MEPRAAVAEWNEDNLTVWAGCDGPFRAQQALAEEFGIPRERVRVIIPDMGGGFGGKHTAEAALEAARLAKSAGKPVSVRWTRTEEFTWAYCRPAALIECRGWPEILTAHSSAWEFTNINAGGSAIDTPYAIPNTQISPPLVLTLPCAKDPIGAWRQRGTTSPGSRSWTSLLPLPALIRWSSDWPTWRISVSGLSSKRPRGKFNWSERRKKVTPELGVGPGLRDREELRCSRLCRGCG